jgi:hypothetical protein
MSPQLDGGDGGYLFRLYRERTNGIFPPVYMCREDRRHWVVDLPGRAPYFDWNPLAKSKETRLDGKGRRSTYFDRNLSFRLRDARLGAETLSHGEGSSSQQHPPKTVLLEKLEAQERWYLEEAQKLIDRGMISAAELHEAHNTKIAIALDLDRDREIRILALPLEEFLAESYFEDQLACISHPSLCGYEFGYLGNWDAFKLDPPQALKNYVARVYCQIIRERYQGSTVES